MAGELKLPDGRCQPAGLPLDMACPPGQRALDDGRCQPAGVPTEACAAGRFEPDGRGGCAAILPETTCPSGWMAVPGERVCREVSPCGEGPWGDIPVEVTTEFVDAAYAGDDSDGSREKPWKTVREGVRAASPGAIVAVAAGSYREGVVITGKPVRLWGRCPALTEVVGAGVQTGAINILRERASGSEVRGLAVTGPSAGVFVQAARSVVLERVWIREAESFGVGVLAQAEVTLRGALVERTLTVGVIVEGSEAAVEATVVRATQPGGLVQKGFGISVQPDDTTGERGKLLLTGSLIEENHEISLLVEGSEATVEASVVRATRQSGAGQLGWGISVEPNPWTEEGAKLWLTSSLVEDSHEYGMYVEGSAATVEASVVRATRQDRTGMGGGRGIALDPNLSTGEGGKLILTGSLVEENQGVGVYVLGSEVVVEASVVRATRQDVAGEGGLGILAGMDPTTRREGRLWLTASVVEDNHNVGVYVEGSEAVVEASVVRATQLDSRGEYGRGISVLPDRDRGEGGKLRLTASIVEDNHSTGLFLNGAEATVEASVVRATRPHTRGDYGRGISVLRFSETGKQGKLLLRASLVEENHEVGVFVAGAEVTMEACVVRATQPSGSRQGGRGINVQPYPITGERGTLSLRSSLVEENHEMGIFVMGSDAAVESTVVRATQPNDLGHGGRGINVQADMRTGEGGKLLLANSLVEENHEVGVYVSGSEATAFATVVRATKVSPADEKFGDGILVSDELGQSHVVLAEIESTDSARVGVMYVGSTGDLSFTRSSGNRFGLVLQPGASGARPVLGEGNLFEGNTEQDTLVGGDMPVPSAALPLP